jgi:hypothetical protein
MNQHTDNKFFRYLLILLLFVLGINGMTGGLLLMLKPNGSLIKMDINWLSGSPFINFLIPGILLFVFNGVIPLLTFAGMVFRFDSKLLNFLNIYPDIHWAWSYSLYCGIITIIWITIQLLLTQYFWLQPIIIFMGLGIIICTLIPGVMNFNKLNSKRNA